MRLPGKDSAGRACIRCVRDIDAFGPSVSFYRYGQAIEPFDRDETVDFIKQRAQSGRDVQTGLPLTRFRLDL